MDSVLSGSGKRFDLAEIIYPSKNTASNVMIKRAAKRNALVKKNLPV